MSLWTQMGAPPSLLSATSNLTWKHLQTGNHTLTLWQKPLSMPSLLLLDCCNGVLLWLPGKTTSMSKTLPQGLWLPIKFRKHYESEIPKPLLLSDLLPLKAHPNTSGLLALTYSSFPTLDCKPWGTKLSLLQPKHCKMLSLLIFKVHHPWISLKNALSTIFSSKLTI